MIDWQRVAQIEQRAAAATKGPWKGEWREASPFRWAEAPQGAYYAIVGHDGLHLATTWEVNPKSPVTSDIRDGDFMAAAREDVPWLIEQIRALADQSADSKAGTV